MVETDAGLHALAAEWHALWLATPEATPFQSPHWLLPWWHHFGTGMPRVAVSREGGTLRGLLPLYVLPQERKALAIGAGTTDYLDALGEAPGLLAAALHRLRDDGVETCDLTDLPPGSPLVDERPEGWAATWALGETAPVLDVADVPARMRRNLRMSRNRAARAGHCEIETATAATTGPMLEDLFRLHQARWAARGEAGVLADARVRAFLAEAAPALAAHGMLRLQRLRLGAETLATILALLAPGRLFLYLSGFAESQAFISPGTLLIGAMLEQARDEGRSEIHFLRGREHYKYGWGAVDRHNRTGRFRPL